VCSVTRLALPATRHGSAFLKRLNCVERDPILTPHHDSRHAPLSDHSAHPVGFIELIVSVVMQKHNQPRDDPALEFCRLCREGKLFEAETWLKSGKPAQYDHKNVRCTPLGIAIDRNFHSLVEVLLRNAFKPEPRHLWLAVRGARTGIVELMLQRGAGLRWLDFRQAAYWPHPDLLRLLIRRGADTKTGYPIADVLKRGPRAFLGIYREYIDQHPEWHFQANMALRHFCREGSMRGVCLLLWINADPRAKVPEKADDDEDM